MSEDHEVTRRNFLLSTAMVTASAAVAHASPAAGAGILASLDAAQSGGVDREQGDEQSGNRSKKKRKRSKEKEKKKPMCK